MDNGDNELLRVDDHEPELINVGEDVGQPSYN